MIVCARQGCGQKFDRSAHNQKYCSPECLRDATNQRFREKYHENKANSNRGPRFCECGSKLSKYNAGDKCSKCEASDRSKRTKELREFIKGLKD